MSYGEAKLLDSLYVHGFAISVSRGRKVKKVAQVRVVFISLGRFPCTLGDQPQSDLGQKPWNII